MRHCRYISMALLTLGLVTACSSTPEGPEHQVLETSTEEEEDEVEESTREHLLREATQKHKQARNAQAHATIEEDDELFAEAEDYYRKAAVTYADYLARYSEDDDAPVWRYHYAEVLYQAGQFRDAYAEYVAVRESGAEDEALRVRSDFAAVQSLEVLLSELVADEELPASAFEEVEVASEEYAEDMVGGRMAPEYGALLAQIACTEGVAEACIDLGYRYVRGDGVEADEQRAGDLFEAACEVGRPDDCERLP